MAQVEKLLVFLALGRDSASFRSVVSGGTEQHCPSRESGAQLISLPVGRQFGRSAC
jgi:hypothetical protein